MNIVSKATSILLAGSLYCNYTQAQTAGNSVSIPLTDLSAFKNPGKNWVMAADASSDYTKIGDLVPVKGSGAVLNINSPKSNSHLVTIREFGDLELDLDFMMVKGSNSGVLFARQIRGAVIRQLGEIESGIH